ncbi:YraN family protein [Devriesea agamarum]|uniref:YraN family protein n=1 Tax=Devriesea agamarum TaxID=472569 RepID=UPI002F9085F2
MNNALDSSPRRSVAQLDGGAASHRDPISMSSHAPPDAKAAVADAGVAVASAGLALGNPGLTPSNASAVMSGVVVPGVVMPDLAGLDGMRPVPTGHMTRGEVGRYGEEFAARYLEKIGWNVLDRNYRVARGELDIVALDGTTLVFVEVKTRRSVAAGSPQAAVNVSKLARLRRLAGYYLMDNAPPHRDLRIDVLGIVLLPGQPVVEHVRGVGQ